MFLFTIIGIMLSGVGIGYLLRNKKTSQIHLVITALIWILLFLLGMEVGNNQDIIHGLNSIGLEALIITVAAVIGSSLCAWLLWIFITKRDKRRNKK